MNNSFGYKEGVLVTRMVLPELDYWGVEEERFKASGQEKQINREGVTIASLAKVKEIKLNVSGDLDMVFGWRSL